MTITATVNEQLHVLSCATCAIYFAVTDRFKQIRRDDHATFYCPAGHRNYYPGKSEKEKLEAALRAKQQELESVRAQRDVLGKRLSAAKAVQTKLKKKVERATHGTCTECNRTFANVTRHMAMVHGKQRAKKASA